MRGRTGASNRLPVSDCGSPLFPLHCGIHLTIFGGTRARTREDPAEGGPRQVPPQTQLRRSKSSGFVIAALCLCAYIPRCTSDEEELRCGRGGP